MNGKDICNVLKEIRKNIADQNNIPYETHECTHKGECKGTCPRCESEMRYLEREISKKRSKGKLVALAGISAVAVAGTTGCSAILPLAAVTQTLVSGLDSGPGDSQPTGDIPDVLPVTDQSESEDIYELDGDVAYTIGETDEPEILMGEIAETDPYYEEMGDVYADDLPGESTVEE